MQGNNTVVTIVMIVIVLHFIVGFVFLARKLSGKPQDQQEENLE